MAFDTYIAFSKDIKGESTAIKDSIELFSFSWGASSPATVGGGKGGISASRVSISSFNFMKKTDTSSTQLFLAACQGSIIPTVTVHMRKQTGGGQQDFLIMTFTNAMVESIQQSGSSGGDDTPTESVSLAFEKIALSYKKTGPDNKLSAGGDAAWDLTKLVTK
jgi:type VI secretion system secreted protein Hcp